MAYSINPNLPKARAIAMQMLVREGLPLQTVANRCGVSRTTIWRWKRKWDKLNENIELRNYYRPSRATGKVFRLAACIWNIPTLVSRPYTSPHAVAEHIVTRVLELRSTLSRSASKPTPIAARLAKTTAPLTKFTGARSSSSGATRFALDSMTSCVTSPSK